MKKEILNFFPEFSLFESKEMKDKTLKVFIKAMKKGGWKPHDLVDMPFTLLIDPCPANMVKHVRGVTAVAYKAAQELKKIYGERMNIDMDALLSGALLHDIGKLLEYELEEGKYVKGEFGKFLRHPFSGMALAYEEGLPPKVQHIIAVHAREGEKSRVCAESIIVHHADFTNFEPLKL